MMGRDRGAMDLRKRMDELQVVDERITALAEKDPMGALFVIRNLGREKGLDPMPLLAKILLRMAERLDTAVREDRPEQARVAKTLIQTLVREMEMAPAYEGAQVGTARQPDELLEEVSLEESLAALRSPPG